MHSTADSGVAAQAGAPPPLPAAPPTEAASRGLPSRVWQAGQDRRFALIQRHAQLDGARVVDLGCGVGIYTAQMQAAGARAVGLEIDWPRAREARAGGLAVVAAVGEALPFADGTVDTLLLHEVLEHVASDRQTAREVTRVLAPGGRAVIFVPNRWWPFETHGVMWRGRYHFGNIPLVNYLPDPARNRLAPHVRVYTAAGIRALFDGLPVRVVVHTQVYPGYDKLVARRPRLGRLARQVTYALERTPLRRLGLSHLLVVERCGAA
jgi:SAM-dependent methyltransferase